MSSKNETAGNEEGLKNEMHSEERKHICPECQKSFTHKSSLKIHLMIHSGVQPFICQTCSKKFRRKSNLNTHMLSHSGAKKPHECQTCQKGFTLKGDLNVHLRIHSQEKSFVCPTCSKRFRHKGALNRHRLIHSGVSYECPTCHKRLTQKGHLKRHLITHSDLSVQSNVTTNKCDSCQKGFYYKSDLIKHIRLHSGETPYTCDVCKKEFSLKNGLIRHLRVHSGQKPFSCSTCKSAFADRSTLKRHLKIHLSNQLSNNSLKTKSSTSKPKEYLQKYDELLKKFGCWRNVRVVCYKLTDDKIQLYSLKGYLENVKKEIDDGLEQNESDFCFEVPPIKEESNPEDELADEPTPYTSYQRVKQEAEDDVDPTTINLCDHLFIKQEKET